jgi:hypothetical protein
MPDFDFDAFNHDEPYNPEDANASEARVTAPLPINTETSSQETPDDKDPIEITEKKPLEARDTKASEGDNLSGEEVDKW